MDKRPFYILESWFLMIILASCNIGIAFFVWNIVNFILDYLVRPVTS
jgi:hypothetical protein